MTRNQSSMTIGISFIVIVNFDLEFITSTNLRQCNRPNLNHQKTIVMAQIIALGKIKNYGSIESMIKLIAPYCSELGVLGCIHNTAIFTKYKG